MQNNKKRSLERTSFLLGTYNKNGDARDIYKNVKKN